MGRTTRRTVLAAFMLATVCCAHACDHKDEPANGDRDAGLDANSSDSADSSADAADAGSDIGDGSSVLSCGAFSFTDSDVTVWPADPSFFCTHSTGFGAGGQSIYDCSGFHVLHTQGVDAQWWLYFEEQTGSLFAAVIYSANSGTTSCYGPPTFEPPSCSATPTPICFPGYDASVGDAGDAGDAGAD